MFDVDKYCRILEVSPYASLEEINQCHADLSWIWHPDRFPNQPRLQSLAKRRFQEINTAHQRLVQLLLNKPQPSYQSCQSAYPPKPRREVSPWLD